MFRFAIAFSAFLLAAALPARADQIDGGWCSEDGMKRIHINGPNIEIPSGRKITGAYTRHAFTYTGPAGDPEDGQEIRMVQQSDEHMILYRSTEPDSFEDWHRCQVTS
ncbi:MAG: hypothetical protein M9908_05260 [Phyllobacteriaceae bacterium]|nr:hypothetical protein [Phyllobacteriaceae bacterium]